MCRIWVVYPYVLYSTKEVDYFHVKRDSRSGLHTVWTMLRGFLKQVSYSYFIIATGHILSIVIKVYHDIYKSHFCSRCKKCQKLTTEISEIIFTLLASDAYRKRTVNWLTCVLFGVSNSFKNIMRSVWCLIYKLFELLWRFFRAMMNAFLRTNHH